MNLLPSIRKSDRRSALKASDRLQDLLAYDRANITPGRLEALREEMIVVISKYFAIEAGNVRLELSRERNLHKLIADIPLAPQNRRRR
jgi:cell division topological specificity factor